MRRALSWFLAVTCWVVAYRKLIGHPVTMATHQLWGFPPALTFALAGLEATAGVLLVVSRRTALWGALTFAGVLTGAVILHLAHGDAAKTLLPLAFMAPTAALVRLTRRPEPREPRSG